MIRVTKEPEGFLLRREDILAWLPGLTKRVWRKIRPTLTARYVPGGIRPVYAGQRPFYSKEEVRAKLSIPTETQKAS